MSRTVLVSSIAWSHLSNSKLRVCRLTNKIFLGFQCRDLGNGLSVMVADYAVSCDMASGSYFIIFVLDAFVRAPTPHPPIHPANQRGICAMFRAASMIEPPHGSSCGL